MYLHPFVIFSCVDEVRWEALGKNLEPKGDAKLEKFGNLWSGGRLFYLKIFFPAISFLLSVLFSSHCSVMKMEVVTN